MMHEVLIRLLAPVVAHRTECRFICVSGSTLVQSFIDEGSQMVRDLLLKGQ